MRVRATINNQTEDSHITEQPRFLVDMGYSRSPAEIIAIIKKNKQVTLEFLNGQETCSTLHFGKLLGEGKSGSVFEIDDPDNKGLPVVLKEFEAKSAPKKYDQEKQVYVLSSSLNDIVMSSIFHSFFEGSDGDYCACFPYYEGFFVCEGTGYAIIEKLDMTLSKYIASNKFEVEAFRSIIFECFFLILFMNRKKVVHNDMHAKNIMIRKTKGLYYQGQKLNDYRHFALGNGGQNYYLPNCGVIAKLVDFDFATKYSHPQVVPNKVYVKQPDEWNLQFRFATSYDALTFAAYLVYYVIIRNPGRQKGEASRIVENVAEFFVKRIERDVGKIKYRGHYEMETSGQRRNRDAVSKLMDVVAVPCYRPREKYCHLDLSGILDLECFREYRGHRNGAALIGSLSH